MSPLLTPSGAASSGLISASSSDRRTLSASDLPGHRGVVVVEAPTRHQHERVLVAGHLDRGTVLQRHEAALAVRPGEDLGVQDAGARMVVAGAGPLQAALFQTLVADAPVVRRQPGDLVHDLRRIARSRSPRRPCAWLSRRLIHQSGLLSPIGSIALRTLWTRRSVLVNVPSFSAKLAAGRTTSANSAVSLRNRSWKTKKSRLLERLDDVVAVGVGQHRVLAHDVESLDLPFARPRASSRSA